jgi:hypothetical protein
MLLANERIYTNNTITINLEVVLWIDYSKDLFGKLQVIEDCKGTPYGLSIEGKEYYPMLCFEETEGTQQILISDKDINDVLGLQIQTYTDNCSIIFENIHD